MSATLGTYIRDRWQDLGLSQEQLAERVSETYSQADVSRLERGITELPRLETLSMLSGAREVPVGNLLIAAGWFDEGHIATMPTADEAIQRDTLETVLGEIEAELDTIHDFSGVDSIYSISRTTVFLGGDGGDYLTNLDGGTFNANPGDDTVQYNIGCNFSD